MHTAAIDTRICRDLSQSDAARTERLRLSQLPQLLVSLDERLKREILSIILGLREPSAHGHDAGFVSPHQGFEGLPVAVSGHR